LTPAIRPFSSKPLQVVTMSVTTGLGTHCAQAGEAEAVATAATLLLSANVQRRTDILFRPTT
jgi:hypothetical protein